MLVFAEGGKPEDPENNPYNRVENQHRLNSLMVSGPVGPLVPLVGVEVQGNN